MRIKYFGNMKDDNGHIRENTRIAVIYYKDSEIDKISKLYHVLKNEGYKFSFSTDNGDGLNEDWYSVIDKDEYEDLKDVYMQFKRGEYETDTEETTSSETTDTTETTEQCYRELDGDEYIYMLGKMHKARQEYLTRNSAAETPEPLDNKHEQPDDASETDKEESVSEVKECTSCPECIYYEKCTSNAPERIQCKSKYPCIVLSCCADFQSRKSIDDIYEEQKKTEPVYEPESDSDYGDILEDDDLPF